MYTYGSYVQITPSVLFRSIRLYVPQKSWFLERLINGGKVAEQG